MSIVELAAWFIVGFVVVSIVFGVIGAILITRQSNKRRKELLAEWEKKDE